MQCKPSTNAAYPMSYSFYLRVIHASCLLVCTHKVSPRQQISSCVYDECRCTNRQTNAKAICHKPGDHRTNKTDISYLKTSRVFFYTNYSIEGCIQQQISLSLIAAVEWIRQSHHVARPAKVLPQQFRSALPVSN